MFDGPLPTPERIKEVGGLEGASEEAVPEVKRATRGRWMLRRRVRRVRCGMEGRIEVLRG